MRTRKLFVTASSLAVLGLVLASCAGATAPAPAPKGTAEGASPLAATPSPKQAPPSPSAVLAGEPRYGGVLTVSYSEDLSSLDLHQETQTQAANMLMLAYSGLTQFNPEQPEEIIGDLAKSWEVSKDALIYTFHLQENVKFHDGSALTAEDVRYSFERQINPPKGIRSLRMSDLGAIDKVEAPDRDTVRFTLKHPSGPTISAISLGWMAIYSKDFVQKKGDMKKDVLGTGPFKLKGYAVGTSVEHVKNPDYFVKGRPYLDGVTFYIIKDTASRFAALRTGRVKLTGVGMVGLSPSDAENLKKTSSPIIAMPYDSLAFANFLVNTQQEPWTDVRVRRAAHLAIDRQTAIDVLAQGYAALGSNMPGKWGIPREELLKMPGWRHPKDADLSEAKRLMAEAGFASGFKAKAMIKPGKDWENLALYVTDQLAKIGIQLEVDIKESAVRVAVLAQGTFSSHPIPTGVLGYPDPLNLARYWAPPVGGDFAMNYQRFVDTNIIDLFEKQSRAIDPREREKLVRELDLRIIDSAARPVIFWWRQILGMWPEVKNQKPPLGYYTSQKYQDVWLAK